MDGDDFSPGLRSAETCEAKIIDLNRDAACAGGSGNEFQAVRENPIQAVGSGVELDDRCVVSWKRPVFGVPQNKPLGKGGGNAHVKRFSTGTKEIIRVNCTDIGENSADGVSARQVVRRAGSRA